MWTRGISQGISRCADSSQHWLAVGCQAGSALVGTAWPQRDTRLRAVKAQERTQQNPALGCSGLGLAMRVAFAFRLRLRGQLVPAGCRQEKVPAVAAGVYWEEDSLFLLLCKSNDPRDLALGEVKRCRFESGWCGNSAAPGAAQRHWCSTATPVTAPPLSPFCVPASLH